MPSQVPLRTVKDYENYLARLRQLPRAFDQTTTAIRLGMRDHLAPPRYLLEKVATQAQDIADKPTDKSPYAQPVLKFPANIPAAERPVCTTPFWRR